MCNFGFNSVLGQAESSVTETCVQPKSCSRHQLLFILQLRERNLTIYLDGELKRVHMHLTLILLERLFFFFKLLTDMKFHSRVLNKTLDPKE